MPVLLASAPPFLVEVATLIVCGALIAYAGYRVGLVPIVGFLLTGVIIGPNALGLVQDQALIDATAEVGVILLLFTIGIEFSLEKLARIQRLIFGGGGLQVLLATAATAGVLAAFGVPWPAGVFTGFLLALSSTAIVLKLLGDRSETASPPGQVGLGLLIFQDLAIIVMVLLVPMLAGTGGTAGEIVWALAKAGLVIAVVLVGARRLMPPLLERVARTCSQELFLLALIAVCFGTAYLTSLAGVSVALGAFLAGLVVSESRFSEHAFGEIMPLQILFSATFFVSVGMLLDLAFLVDNLPVVVGAVVGVLVVKLTTTALAVRALGYGLPVAAASSLYLAQVGEFSFVLERAGSELGLTPAGLGEAGSQTFIAATVLLMVLTPPLSAFGMRLRRRLEARAPAADPAAGPAMPEPVPTDEGEVDLEDHVIVAGYGRTARRLVRTLRAADVPHAVITLSPPHADDAEAAGLAVVRGDVARSTSLRLAGAARARLLVIPETDTEAAVRVAAVARTVRPTLPILARARYRADAEALEAAGVGAVVVEEFEDVLALLGAVLRTYGAPDGAVEHRSAALRADGYRALLEVPTAAVAPVGDGASMPVAPDAAADGAARVRVYGADWCPLTGGFRAYLKREDIPYTYHDIENDPEAEDAVRAMNDGKVKFPMVVVGDRAMKNPPIDELREALRAHGLTAAGDPA